MKKIKWGLTLCVIICVFLGACQTKPQQNEDTGSGETPKPQQEAEDTSEKIVIRFGHNYAIDHPAEIVAQEMKEELEERSGGRIVLESYPSAQLGASRELMTGIMNGTVEMCVTSTFGTVEERILSVEMPYLFKDMDHIRTFVDSPYSEELLKLLETQNVHACGWWPVGYRNIGNSKREVKTPEDLKGLTIRAFENEMLIDTLTSLGANVTVLPVTEVYTALQTGAIDGEENPYLNTYTMKFYEVAKYKTESRHLFNFDIVAFSKTFWDSLSPEDQALLEEVVKKGCERYTTLVEESDSEYRKALETEGVRITEIEDYEPWKAAVQPVYDKWEAKLGKEFIEGVQNLVEW